MKNFHDITKDWKNQSLSSSVNDMDSNLVIKQYVRKERNQKLKAAILIFLLLSVLTYLILFANFRLWTTYVGLSIFILVTLYLIYIRLYKRAEVSSLELMENSEFLALLKNKKNETCVGNTRQQTNLFIIYAIGFGFYIYETASESTTSLIIGYGALSVYLLAAKFLYFPLISKRKKRKTDEIIHQINALQHQFNENII